jgi:uncharacterized protein (DUF1330 family)
MSVYFIATSSITDPELVASYLADAGATLAGHDVKLLAVTTEATAVEGEPPGSRVVVMEFTDEAAFRAWYDSPAYQAILPRRLNGTKGYSVLVDRYDPTPRAT